MALNWLLALGGEFDVVLEIDGFNEVALHEAENAPKHVHPAYPRSWYFHAAGLDDPRTATLVADVVRLRDALAANARRFSGVFGDRLATANLIWTLRDRSLVGRLAAATERLRQRPVDAEGYSVTGPRFDASGADEPYRFLADLWLESSLQMARLCRANGIAYVQVLQPNQYVPGSKPMGPDERARAVRADQPYRRGVERGYPLLVDAGRRLREDGVHFLDMTQAYAGVDEPLYVDDCCHVNARGDALLVPAIAAEIRAALREVREGRAAR